MEKIFTLIQDNKILNIIIVTIIIILSIMISSIFSFLTIILLRLKENHIKIKKSPLYKSIKGVFFLIGIYFAILILNLPDDWFVICKTIIRILIICKVARIVIELIAPDSKFIKKIKESHKANGDEGLVKVLIKFGKIRSIHNYRVFNYFRTSL